MKIFLICPVANAEPKTQKKIAAYVKSVEKKGHRIHWPTRDTKQDDPTGGFEICKTNFRVILDADEIHIWYDESSGGSKFDMGGVFMLVEMLKEKKKIVIVNDKEIAALAGDPRKSFYKVFKRLIENAK